MSVCVCEIPDEINTIAVPASWVSMFISKKERTYILVIKKRPPESESEGCGARHWYKFKLDMLPRGGIALPGNPRADKFTVILERKLRYGKVGLRARYYDVSGKEDLIGKAIEEWDQCMLKGYGYPIFAEGYLVFQRLSEKEWRLTKEEPEAYIYVKGYSLESRAACAGYKILSTRNVYGYWEEGTCCAISSMAAMLLLLPTRGDAVVEYDYVDAGYRGPVEHVRKMVKIAWNNGEPLEQPHEDIGEEEII